MHYPKLSGPITPSDRISMKAKSLPQHEPPRPLTQKKSSEWEPAKLFGSFENQVSMASSFQSVSSAGASTNTSFSARSLATSFDSSVDSSDTTKPHSWDHPPHLLPSVLVGPGSESLVAYPSENEMSKVSTDDTITLPDPPDPMDIDPEPGDKNRTSSLNAPLDLQGQVKPKTSSTIAAELLAIRLHESSPFGNVSPSQYHAHFS